MEFRDQMKVLIQLSLVDNVLSNFEKRTIYTIGKANGLPEREIDELFEEALSKRVHELPDALPVSEDGKLDCLYNIVQLMKVDKKIYLSEIKFCEELATKLGYKKKLVKQLSSRIFSDPSITADRSQLQKLLKKYRLD